MWHLSEARLMQIQRSVKRLKYAKVGGKKGWKTGKKKKKGIKNKRGKKNRNKK
jgi:hypothetical protein